MAFAGLLTLAASADAQTFRQVDPNRAPTAPRGLIAPDGQLERFALEAQRLGPISQHMAGPLTGAQFMSLSRARVLRDQSQFDAARDTLTRVLALAPHHPVVLWELANVHRARQDWKAVEQLARAERASTRDSLLLAQEYVEALERLERPRDAAPVVIEAWVADPIAGPWASATLLRLSDGGVKGIDRTLREAATARPEREDLTRAAARMAWRAGDARSALQLLSAADRQHPLDTPTRWTFAGEMLSAGVARDSSAAIEALLDLAADSGRDPAYRLSAGRRVMQVAEHHGDEVAIAPRLARALQDLPPERWGNDLVIVTARALRRGGSGAQARALLENAGRGVEPTSDLVLERALDQLRESADSRAVAALASVARSSREAGFRYAEALFFSGQSDSALTWYDRMSHDASGLFTGAALERLYLIEDADPKDALPAFGRLAWEEWRGEPKRALPVADSLYRSMPRGALWAHAALSLARLREGAGDGRSALEPLLALADSLPGDRQAPLARQRAGDVLRVWYKDDARALAQYEECLARYPRAWNSAEVRRQAELLRREKRF